jgi:hypothetical protein
MATTTITLTQGPYNSGSFTYLSGMGGFATQLEEDAMLAQNWLRPWRIYVACRIPLSVMLSQAPSLAPMQSGVTGTTYFSAASCQAWCNHYGLAWNYP